MAENIDDYLSKFCDNTKLLWAFKGIKHLNNIFMLQLSQDLQNYEYQISTVSPVVKV